MILYAYAKINLRLKVVGIYPNGYHELEMVNTKINLRDEIDITEYKHNELNFLNSNLYPNKDNLILKIVNYFNDIYKVSKHYKININKNIPVGAGLGGGSSDAAEIIKFINMDNNLNLSLDELIKIGVKFGSDIPFCLQDYPCKVLGIGEILEKIDCHIYDSLILVYPNINISTKDVFNHCDFNSSKNSFYEFNEDLIDNDLEKPATLIYPELKKVKEYLKNLDINNLVMSGSGSSFILFVDKNKVNDIYKQIINDTNYFVRIVEARNVF